MTSLPPVRSAPSSTKNGSRSARVISRLFPSYTPRWIIYEEMLKRSVGPETDWVDIGCGKNDNVAEHGPRAKSAVGVDVVDHPHRTGAPFLQADTDTIPLPSGCADLVTMRMVVEHLERVPEDFAEPIRLLRPGGTLIVLTTNAWSPVIVLPRLLPDGLKRAIIRSVYGAEEHDVFRTHHRFNSARVMARGLPQLSLSSIRFIEGIPESGLLMTSFFGLWYAVVQWHPLRFFRSNILATFVKR